MDDAQRAQLSTNRKRRGKSTQIRFVGAVPCVAPPVPRAFLRGEHPGKFALFLLGAVPARVIFAEAAVRAPLSAR